MTMMPSPPNHCVRLRQNRMLCGSVSMDGSTVSPVVVKPEMLSKNASRKPRCPPNTYGIMPSTVATPQPSPVIAMPSRIVMASTFARACETKSAQTASDSPMESANARALSSPQRSASKSGTQSTAIDARTSLASTKFTTRKSMEGPPFLPISLENSRRLM